VPYDSLVFLHRFGPQSWPYTFSDPGRLTVFVGCNCPFYTRFLVLERKKDPFWEH